MLKSLELAGFKSFADKTRFDFLDGVTVVVGPNGSGKSNVVDALKWILGSQSPRSLRGKEMTDVIFNGSASRGPMNMAEATLAFENPPPEEGQRRLFDLDEVEVRLTRRVYRSGEGEYLINGRTARLRDFRELLAGTGIGVDSYSIIEQGKVDAALNASPHERRLLFEEAAGISRFRLKKREAAKRLERVEQNLLRLSDIVDEVETRLRRVRSQAGKAQKYREQTERLREVRLRLAAADWRALTDEWRSLDDQHRLLSSRLQESRAQAQQQEDKIANAAIDEQTAARAQESDERLQRLRDALSRDVSLLEFERRRSTDLTQQVLEFKLTLLNTQREALQPADERDEEALAAAEATAEECRTALEVAKQRTEESAQLAEALRSRLSEARTSQEQHAAAATEASRDEHRLQDRLVASERGLEELRIEIAHAEQEASETHSNLERAQAATQSLEASLTEVESQHSGLAERLANDRKQLAAAHQQVSEQHALEVETRHRLESLSAEEQRLEKLNRDVRALIDTAAKQGEAPQVFGLVADLIQVDVDLATLVEAALEGKTHHVVVDSGESILAAHASQSDAFGARASFQRLDCQTPAAAVDRIDLGGEPGVMGRADDFVEADAKFAGLLQRLLGRTWFVDTAETAIRLSKSVGRGLTFVTFAGEVIAADGTLLVGPREDRDGVLTRRRRAAQLRMSLAEYDRARQEAEQRLAALQSAVEQGEAAQSHSSEEVDTLRRQLTEGAQQAAALIERERQISALLQRNQEKLTAQTTQIESLRRELQAVTERHKHEAAEAEQIAREVEALDHQLDATEAVCVTERARVSELDASVARHEQLLASLRQATTPEGTDREAPVEEARQAMVQAEQERASSELCLLQASTRIAEAALERERWEGVRREALRADALARSIRADSSAALSTLRAEVEQLLTRVAQVELRRQQVELERRNTMERVKEDYEIDLAEVINDTEPTPDEAIDRESLTREAETLRRQVNSIGSVNLESLEELDDLETRFQELSSQYNDLTQAKTMLTRLTNRINADSRELYLASFESVRGHFRELFRRLFGGGEADLVLVSEEGDDPLESGVDIIASPPGKELRSLSLMSGGEKTMACVALLLALFRSKPSPFCVLDEVDAALDDANIGRFSGVLGEFLSTTQFVVITHSKRTMTLADTLYGVTMQESGVSKQVSVRFEDVSEDGHISPQSLAAPSEERRAA